MTDWYVNTINGYKFLGASQPYTNANGVQRPADWLRTASPAEREAEGAVATQYVNGTYSGDASFYSQAEEFGAGTITRTYTLKPDAQLRELQRQRLAAKRYAVETSGITFDGVIYDSSPESRAAIRRLLDDVSRKIVPSVRYKARPGAETVVELGLSELMGLHDTLVIFEQSCRNYEATLLEAIMDPQTTDINIASIDVNSGWPDPSDPTLALGRQDFIALIKRRASALEDAGQATEALLLLQKYGVSS
jgi:hypothetical protein